MRALGLLASCLDGQEQRCQLNPLALGGRTRTYDSDPIQHGRCGHHPHLPAPGKALAICSGEHDVATIDAALELLGGLVERNEVVRVDLSEATFIDAAFIGCLVGARDAGERSGCDFDVVVRARSPCMRTLEVAGAYELLVRGDELRCEERRSPAERDERRS